MGIKFAVDPLRQVVTVTLLKNGGAIPIFSDPGCRTVANPVITDTTFFYAKEPGAYSISLVTGGQESATSFGEPANLYLPAGGPLPTCSPVVGLAIGQGQAFPFESNAPGLNHGQFLLNPVVGGLYLPCISNANGSDAPAAFIDVGQFNGVTTGWLKNNASSALDLTIDGAIVDQPADPSGDAFTIAFGINNFAPIRIAVAKPILMVVSTTGALGGGQVGGTVGNGTVYMLRLA